MPAGPHSEGALKLGSGPHSEGALKLGSGPHSEGALRMDTFFDDLLPPCFPYESNGFAAANKNGNFF